MGRLEGLELLHNIAKSRGDIYLTALRKVSYEVYGRTEGVVRRKREERSLCYLKIVHSLLHIRADILEREHYTLALSCSTRGEHDARELFVVYGILKVASVARCKLFSTCRAKLGKRSCALCLAAHRNEMRCHGCLGAYRLDLFKYIASKEDILALCGIDYRCDIGHGKVLVDRHGYRSYVHNRGIGHKPINRRAADDSDLLVLKLHAMKLGGKRAHVIAALRKGYLTRFLYLRIKLVLKRHLVRIALCNVFNHLAKV